MKHVLRTVFLVAFAAQSALAGDWPQILGPHRDGWSSDLQDLPAHLDQVPQAPIWEIAIGSGVAGVAVADDLVILFHRQDDRELIAAYRATTGKPVWEHGYPSHFQPQILDDNGPRCVPAIAAGRVFTFGATGVLTALQLKTGRVLWSRPTHAETGASEGYFGAGSSPLATEKFVVVNVGGKRSDAGVVAYDAMTGKVLWQALKDDASYSTPVLATLKGQEQLLVLSRLQFTSFDPVTGRQNWQTPFGQRGPTVNAAAPLVRDDTILLTASYGIGAELLDASGDSPKVLWSEPVLSSQYATPLWRAGVVYGVDGRQDGPPPTLKCFDAQTRKVYWEHPLPEYGTLVGGQQRALYVQTNGLARLFDVAVEGYRERGTLTIGQGTTRALPALANNCLYVRDETHLRCYSLRVEK